MNTKEAIKLVKEELKSANGKFPLFNSSHEGYAVIKEELDELWDDGEDDMDCNFTNRRDGF